MTFADLFSQTNEGNLFAQNNEEPRTKI
jgi:hypothetical protein